jgi:hypothetical protein
VGCCIGRFLTDRCTLRQDHKSEQRQKKAAISAYTEMAARAKIAPARPTVLAVWWVSHRRVLKHSPVALLTLFVIYYKHVLL